MAAGSGWKRVPTQCPHCQESDATKERGGIVRCFRCEITFNPVVGDAAPSTVPEERVEQAHRTLLGSKPMMEFLRAVRGLDDFTIRKYKLGLAAGRIEVPYPDGLGGWQFSKWCDPIDPAKRKPGSREGKLQMPAGSRASLYPLPVDVSRPVLLCAGEWDTLVARRLGFNAYCSGAGESVFRADWAVQVAKAPTITIAYDADERGRQGAVRLARLLRKADALANELRILRLPFPEGRRDLKDLLDWVQLGNGRQEIEALIQETKPFGQKADAPRPDEEVREVPLRESGLERWAGTWCSFRATVASNTESPWLLPKEISVNCDKQGPCQSCRLSGETVPTPPIPLDIFSPEYVDLIDTKFSVHGDKMRRVLGVPPKCSSVAITAVRSLNIWELRLSESFRLDVDRDAAHYHAFSLGVKLEPNTTYKMVARAVSDPRNQLRVHAIREAEKADDDLTSFVPVPTMTRPMRRRKGTKLDVQVAKLVGDMSKVTGIIDRFNLHLLYLLANHSPLWVQWDERRRIKGWLDVLVIGDSGQGKTTAAKEWMDWTGLGQLISCKKVSAAGLLGARAEHRGKFWVEWGVDPQGDKRLLYYDEAKGASPKVLSSLTSARSEGLAELHMAQAQHKTHARTRRVWITNPRSPEDSPLTMGAFGCPVLAIPRIFGSTEDVRRLDMALILQTSDIDPAVYEQAHRSDPELWKRDVSRHSILRAWTLPPVPLTPEAREACQRLGSYLSSRYCADIPLVEPADQREKLARLGAALAVMLQEEVSAEHVEYVAAWMDQVYSAPGFGYLEWSEVNRFAREVADLAIVKQTIEANFAQPAKFYAFLMSQPMLTGDGIRSIFADRIAADRVTATLLQENALRLSGRGYVKTDGFVAFLREELAKKEKQS